MLGGGCGHSNVIAVRSWLVLLLLLIGLGYFSKHEGRKPCSSSDCRGMVGDVRDRDACATAMD